MNRRTGKSYKQVTIKNEDGKKLLTLELKRGALLVYYHDKTLTAEIEVLKEIEKQAMVIYDDIKE